MAMVCMLTAGSGDTYRIERIYLDRDEADRFAQNYNGIAPNEPVHVESGRAALRRGSTAARTWRAEWWARVPVSKRRRVRLRRTREVSASTTSKFAKE